MAFESRERRREPRFPLEEPVQITVLSPSRLSIRATILDVSRHGLQLRTEQLLPVSAPLQLCVGDFLLLGEAVFCVPQEGQFRAGISVEQRLGPLTALADWHRPFSWTAEYARAS
jgi:hypothetical protein